MSAHARGSNVSFLQIQGEMSSESSNLDKICSYAWYAIRNQYLWYNIHLEILV